MPQMIYINHELCTVIYSRLWLPTEIKRPIHQPYIVSNRRNYCRRNISAILMLYSVVFEICVPCTNQYLKTFQTNSVYTFEM